MIQIKLDPLDLFKMTSFFSDLEGTCLLYSGGDFDSASKSFLFLFPFQTIELQDEKDPWNTLKSALNFKEKSDIPSWVGFLSYEMAVISAFDKNIPDAYFQKTAFVLSFDHKTKIAVIYLNREAIPKLSSHEKEWMEKFAEKQFLTSFIQNLPEITPQNETPLTTIKDLETIDTYTQKIETIQEMIRDGDVYQVCLSHDFKLLGDRNPFSLFYTLSQINPAPFSAYLKHKNFSIVSSSPERFLKKSDGLLEARPIKGTMPRGKNEQEDKENKIKLLSSEKDFSELLMITDLLRNDLGKVSLPGSVKTLKIAHLEAYQNVFHLLSIIQSKPIASLHPVELVQACFPGGSITGCPKLSAIQVIRQLEKRNRGIYTGSIGYFTKNGDFDFNIAIRTLFFAKDKIQIQLGGAITIDSSAEAEYEETLQKGESIFKSLTKK